MERKARSKGFTLVEILVVLAIVAVLAAILLPVLSRVREQGRATTCRSNLKQLALAAQLYAQDNNGRIPMPLSPATLTTYINKSSAVYDLFHCPTQAGREGPLMGDGEPWNYITNPVLTDLSISYNVGQPEGRVPKPTATWLQTDEDDTDHSVLIKPSQCTPFTNWHSGGANYSFVDGHVKWLAPKSACDLDKESRSP